VAAEGGYEDLGVASLIRTWGTTAAERTRPFPCDAVLRDADEAYHRGISVEAAPAVVFRWLCQLRAAPYSYDWIDNFGQRSPPRLVPGLDRLEVGQRVMTIFDLVSFEPGRHLTLRLRARTFPGAIAVSYTVVPEGARSSRLLVKLAVRYPRGPLGWVLRRLLPAGDVVMMRRQLLNLKRLAEEDGGRCAGG
jgi:hypothetical protein